MAAGLIELRRIYSRCDSDAGYDDPGYSGSHSPATLEDRAECHRIHQNGRVSRGKEDGAPVRKPGAALIFPIRCLCPTPCKPVTRGWISL
jgi:hypothetical protein